MRDVFPVKYYKDEGFVEHKIEINEDDLQGRSSRTIYYVMPILTSMKSRS